MAKAEASDDDASPLASPPASLPASPRASRSLVNESDMSVLTGVCTAEFSVGYNKEQHRQTCRNTRCTPSRRFRRDLAVPIRYSTMHKYPGFMSTAYVCGAAQDEHVEKNRVKND